LFHTRAQGNAYASQDDSFQELLLTFSRAAAEALSSAGILKIFCRAAAGCLQVSGAYAWHLLPPDHMIAAEAEGWMADRFRNSPPSAGESSLASQAMQQKRPVYFNAITPAYDAMATEYGAKSMMAVPLLMSNQVVGAAVFLHNSDPHFFTSDHLDKASVLAAQVGSLLEAVRLTDRAREEKRRAGILADVVHSPQSEADPAALLEALADRIRDLLRTPLVCILMGEATAYELSAVAAETPTAAATVRNLYDRKNKNKNKDGNEASENNLRFASDLAQRAVLAGEPISVSVDPATHFLTDLVPPGTLLAAPFRTSSKQGAVLVYPRPQGPFSEEEKSLLPVVVNFTALAISNAELLQANAGQASASLENSRFFARMEQANRHWIEIFDSISDFIVAHDESGNVLRVNRSLAEFIGVQPQQLIGLNMGALLATGAALPSRTCPFCRGNGNSADEYLHPVLGRTYLVSTSQVHAASSEGLQTIHVLKDITDRREAERRYRELFDNIQEGLFFCSPDGLFIEVNDALVRMLGHGSRDALLHCDPREEVFPSPARHSELFALLERQGTLRNREEVLRRKDGGAVHVLINAFAVRDALGNVIQYRGLMLDVTGLKAYQSELQRERDFSGKILNNTQSLILVSDTTGLISYANRRWQALGYAQENVLGQPLETLVAPAKRAALRDAYAAVIAGSPVDNLDLQVLRADGRVLQFSVNLSPMRDEQAHVSSIVVVMSDVTDAASLQAKLMHAEKMAAVGQLVSGVAHEVNNPLTAILGFADLMMDNPELPESSRKDLRVILQEAQRTKQIVQNLLSFARQMPPQRKPVQLNVILRRTIQLRAYDFHSRGVAVTEHFDEDLPFVIGDAPQLQQVFLNILNNAYDAVRESVASPSIEISIRRSNNFVEVLFSDNGHGISYPERIFDPFFTTKEVGEGTGLGLSICYGIVKEHGGEIVCSNNLGRDGATFTVRFPSVNDPASHSATTGVNQP
jgi:PAS domain S-box-containing protein